MAHRLRRTTRLSETVARFGGDEFVVLRESADVSAAQTLAHRIRAAVRRPLEQAPEFGLTASLGAVVHLGFDSSVDAEQMVRAADEAMYRSKSLGGDRETVVQL